MPFSNTTACFSFHDTATPEIYTLSLHDALPISVQPGSIMLTRAKGSSATISFLTEVRMPYKPAFETAYSAWPFSPKRSEEHTSELQSHVKIVCRLLLEKKKKSHLITVSGCQHMM